MKDVWGGDAASSLIAACNAGDWADALDVLRHGPFLDVSRCRSADPVLPEAWFTIDTAPAPDPDRGSPLLALLHASAGQSSRLQVRAARSHAGARLLLGIEGGPRRVAHVRTILAPDMLLSPRSPPDPLAGPIAGIVHRLMPLPDRTGMVTSHTTLSRLFALPDSWSVQWTLCPVAGATVDGLLSGLQQCEVYVAPHRRRSERSSATASVEVTNPLAERVSRWLEQVHALASQGSSDGLWTVVCHAAAQPDILPLLTSALRAGLAGGPSDGSAWVTSVYPSPAHEPALPPPASLLTARDVDRLLAIPAASVPGITVRPPMPAGRVQITAGRPLTAGRRAGTSEPFLIDVDDLRGHAFVTGMTGSGKSTTVTTLLVQLWNTYRIPFLVIDPVKADYERIATRLRGGLTVIDGRNLQMNVLTPWPGADQLTHLEQVAAVFKGSFSMPTPVPYVVTLLFDLLADDVGRRPAPTLYDLLHKLPSFVRSLGYSGEAEANIMASVGTRLKLLLAPTRADRVAAGDLGPPTHLLDAPTVVQLDGIGDDEERAFLMSVVTTYMAEGARQRSRTEAVRHVTVLEEAHRILPEPPPAAGAHPDRGDALGTSARLLTQMLAEIRAYGESLIVVDQSPAAVAANATRNTNLKVAHRLVAANDREAVAASMGLDEDEAWGLSRVRTGEAFVSSRLAPEAQLMTVTPPTTDVGGRRSSPQRIGSKWPCCADQDTAAHHRSEPLATEAGALMAVFVSACDRAADLPTLRRRTRTALDHLALHHPGVAAECLAWIGLRRIAALTTYRRSVGPDGLRGDLDGWYGRWRGDSATTLQQSDEPSPLPFAGCKLCTCRCRLPAAAQARLHGVDAVSLRAALAPMARDPIPMARRWRTRHEDQLRDALPAEVTRSLSLCMVQHALRDAGVDQAVMAEVLPDLLQQRMNVRGTTPDS